MLDNEAADLLTMKLDLNAKSQMYQLNCRHGKYFLIYNHFNSNSSRENFPESYMMKLLSESQVGYNPTAIIHTQAF